MATVTHHDEAAWLQMFAPRPRLSWDALDLNRQAIVGFGADGFNVPAHHQPQLLRWNRGDARTLKWRPQGITGSREQGSPARSQWLAVSWYGREQEDYAHHGVRLSLINGEQGSPEFLEYRHVLLVQNLENLGNPAMFRLPAGSPAYNQYQGFGPIPIHAGGIAWVGNMLYVADTQLGFRIFDMTRIYEVRSDPTKSRCGEQGGTLYGFDYRYVLPQVGYYRADGTAPNSFVAVGSGANGRCLWSGQYLKETSEAAPRLFGWPLREDDRIDTTQSAEEFQPSDRGEPAWRMQGAYRAGSTTWSTVTNRSLYQGSTARLLTEAPNAEGLRWRWPHGAEDLYLDADADTLWCLTEFTAGESRGDRFLFGVRFSTYAPALHEDA